MTLNGHITLNYGYAPACMVWCLCMWLLEPATWIWGRINSYYQQPKCDERILVSVWQHKAAYFQVSITGVHWTGCIKWEKDDQRHSLFMPSITMLAEPSEISIRYIVFVPISLARNVWPWMTLSGHFLLNFFLEPVYLTALCCGIWQQLHETNKRK